MDETVEIKVRDGYVMKASIYGYIHSSLVGAIGIFKTKYAGPEGNQCAPWSTGWGGSRDIW